MVLGGLPRQDAHPGCRAQDPPRDYVPFPFDEHDYYKVALQVRWAPDS